jgi:peptidoglycan/LPS O-acetylase OafA/YrhL
MKLGYRPALDGVRAVAITLVVLRHATGYPASGAFGVDVFFVLSGFLITSLLLDERFRYGAVSLRNFYGRRALRLLPALIAMLAFFLGVSIVAYLRHGEALAKPAFGVVAGLGYFTNLALTTHGGVSAMPPALTHLWSLAAEEQFYIVWPALLFVVLRARLRLAGIVLVCGIALMMAEQLRLLLDGTWSPRIEYGVDTRSTSILVGCLLAVLLASGLRPNVEALGRRFGVVGVALLAALVVVDFGRARYAGPLLLVGIASAALILCALDSGSWTSRVLALAPLVFLGRISYALYLWHIPILALFGISHPEVSFRVVPAVAVAVGCAIGSYYLVEKPFLRRKQRLVHAPAETAEAPERGADPRGTLTPRTTEPAASPAA